MRQQSSAEAAMPRGCMFLDIYTGALRRDRMLVQRTKTAELWIGFGRRAELHKRLSIAEALIKAGFDPSQPRDEDGRWTSESSDSRGATFAFDSTGFVAATTQLQRSLFGALGTAARRALGAISLRLGALSAGATAFLGAYFIPLRGSPIADGILPGQSNIRYHYDGDTGEFSLYRDGGRIFSGTAGGDGLIRDHEGNLIGREVDGAVVVDPDAIPGHELSDESPETKTDVDEDEPKLCPDPGPDRGGGRRQRAIDYQFYVSTQINPDDPVPPGLAVRLWSVAKNDWVYFDECYHRIGTMVDAKGPSYGDILEENNAKMVAFLNYEFVKQAESQIGAAGSRAIEWHCAEKITADHIRNLFSGSKELNRIKVIWTPMLLNKAWLEVVPGIVRGSNFWMEIGGSL